MTVPLVSIARRVTNLEDGGFTSVCYSTVGNWWPDGHRTWVTHAEIEWVRFTTWATGGKSNWTKISVSNPMFFTFKPSFLAFVNSHETIWTLGDKMTPQNLTWKKKNVKNSWRKFSREEYNFFLPSHRAKVRRLRLKERWKINWLAKDAYRGIFFRCFTFPWKCILLRGQKQGQMCT